MFLIPDNMFRLIKVARKVERRAARYAAQLKCCKNTLDDGGWFW